MQVGARSGRNGQSGRFVKRPYIVRPHIVRPYIVRPYIVM